MNRTLSVCHAFVVALVLMTAVVACGPAESPDLPVHLTSTLMSADSAAWPREESTEGTSVPTLAVEGVRAQRTVPPTGTRIPRQSAFTLFSDSVGDSYKLYVSLPKGYSSEHPDGYPVIYLLDANWYFDGSSSRIDDGGVAGIVSSLSKSGRIPKAIIIGIGYTTTNQRGRDFLWAPERFYAFLTWELIPFVDSRYRTDANSPRTLVGHSDGGYFALYAFFQTDGNGNTPFGQFIAVSGDLTKNEWLSFREEGKMNRRIVNSGAVGGALFLAVGGREESRFVTSMHDMAERLKSRSYENLRLESRVYGSDDHTSVLTPAIWAGLMWVFGE